MQTERPLLTIAIPTFNRAGYLKELLSTLFDQLVAEPRVELLISDNASPDETPAVVQSFAGRGLPVRYLRNETNIGSDANFKQCFEQAHGKYLWLFGDDDIIVPGGIAKLLPLLASEDYALVYLSPYPFRHDYLAERTRDRFRRFAQTAPDGVQFARKVGTTMAFISAMIVNKDSYRSTEHVNLADFVGSNLVHLGWVLPVLRSGGTNLLVWEKLVAARGGNSGGWGICRVFGDSLKRVIDLTLPDRKDIGTEIVNSTLKNWFPLMVMEVRRGTAGPLEAENMRDGLESIHRKNWRYWVYVFPVITFPYTLARLWYSLTKYVSRSERLLSMVLSYPVWRKNLIWRQR
jgi:abequosyltransferase